MYVIRHFETELWLILHLQTFYTFYAVFPFFNPFLVLTIIQYVLSYIWGTEMIIKALSRTEAGNLMSSFSARIMFDQFSRSDAIVSYSYFHWEHSLQFFFQTSSVNQYFIVFFHQYKVSYVSHYFLCNIRIIFLLALPLVCEVLLMHLSSMCTVKVTKAIKLWVLRIKGSYYIEY